MALSREHTVLLVDDEPLILEVCGAVLRNSGFRVLASRNGKGGLQLFREHKATISLVVSDVVMPDLKGTEMARVMIAEKPDLQVVFISGYGLDALPAEARNNFPLLAKPFTSEQFLGAVRAAIAAATPQVVEWKAQSKTTVFPE